MSVSGTRFSAGKPGREQGRPTLEGFWQVPGANGARALQSKTYRSTVLIPGRRILPTTGVERRPVPGHMEPPHQPVQRPDASGADNTSEEPAAAGRRLAMPSR